MVIKLHISRKAWSPDMLQRSNKIWEIYNNVPHTLPVVSKNFPGRSYGFANSIFLLCWHFKPRPGNWAFWAKQDQGLTHIPYLHITHSRTFGFLHHKCAVLHLIFILLLCRYQYSHISSLLAFSARGWKSDILNEEVIPPDFKLSWNGQFSFHTYDT